MNSCVQFFIIGFSFLAAVIAWLIYLSRCRSVDWYRVEWTNTAGLARSSVVLADNTDEAQDKVEQLEIDLVRVLNVCKDKRP